MVIVASPVRRPLNTPRPQRTSASWPKGDGRLSKMHAGSASYEGTRGHGGAKGVIHVPAHNTLINPGRREALLIAIAKARGRIDDLAHGRAGSFAVIGRRKGKVERPIRLLAPLAFLSPWIVSAILDGRAGRPHAYKARPLAALFLGRAKAAARSSARQSRCSHSYRGLHSLLS
jgi:hypothetical protein